MTTAQYKWGFQERQSGNNYYIGFFNGASGYNTLNIDGPLDSFDISQSGPPSGIFNYSARLAVPSDFNFSDGILLESSPSTVAFWIKTSSGWTGSILEDYGYISRLAFNTTGLIFSTSYNTLTFNISGLNRSNWNHYALTFSSTGGDNLVGRLYINKNLTGTLTTPTLFDVNIGDVWSVYRFYNDSGYVDVAGLTVDVSEAYNQTNINALYTEGNYAGAPPIITSATTFNWNENATGVAYTATAYGQPPIFWSISGGDSALLTMTTGGNLTFNTTPNYEAPIDAGPIIPTYLI